MKYNKSFTHNRECLFQGEMYYFLLEPICNGLLQAFTLQTQNCQRDDQEFWVVKYNLSNFWKIVIARFRETKLINT